MSEASTPRDPLTVPVRDATPEEIEAQARHHATDAAITYLEDFLLKGADEIDAVVANFGEPVAIAFENEHGETVFDLVMIIRLCELDHGRVLVYFEHFTQQSNQRYCAYGVIDASFRTLYTYSVRKHLKGNPDVLMAALRTLDGHVRHTALASAERALQERTES